jgi:VanZ family protein
MRIAKRIILAWTAVVLWFGLIFAFSAQPANESARVSKGLTAIILRFIENLFNLSDTNAEWMDYLVRKSAHTFLFFVLAILVANAVLKTGVKGIRVFIIAFIITSLYACTDEIHQLFVPGRGCMFSDVVIDSAGAIIGLGFFGAVYWIKQHKIVDFSQKNVLCKFIPFRRIFSISPDNE